MGRGARVKIFCEGEAEFEDKKVRSEQGGWFQLYCWVRKRQLEAAVLGSFVS